MVPQHSDCPRARSPHQDLEDLNAGGLKEGWGHGMRRGCRGGCQASSLGFCYANAEATAGRMKVRLGKEGLPKGVLKSRGIWTGSGSGQRPRPRQLTSLRGPVMGSGWGENNRENGGGGWLRLGEKEVLRSSLKHQNIPPSPNQCPQVPGLKDKGEGR